MRTAAAVLGFVFTAVACGDNGAQEPTPPDAAKVVPQDSAVPPPPSDFTRFRRLDDENGLLETAVTTYADEQGHRVSLIAAVHIADAAHYRELAELFATLDAVLYELVAEPDDRPSPDDPARGGLGMVQRAMAGGFELQFQLDGIDYRPDNFVHADLTPREFARLQDERSESFIQLVMRAMQAQMAAMRERDPEEANGTDMDLVAAFRAGYGRHTLRMWFATQIEDIERVAAGFAGPDGQSALVEGRNARAMEVLEETLSGGAEDVAIYYGAAHMPDFEKRLLAQGFTKVGERWLVAWDIHKRKDPKRGESR